MNAPRQGRGEILQPLPGCVSLIHFNQGFAKNAHPWLPCGVLVKLFLNFSYFRYSFLRDRTHLSNKVLESCAKP